MRLVTCVSFIAFIAVLAAPECLEQRALAQGEITVEEIAKSVLANRQRIRSGEVELESTLTAEGGATTTKSYVVYFDDTALRGDVTQAYDKWKEGASFRRSFVSRTAAADVVFYSDRVFPDGGNLIATIERASASTRMIVPPDPRLIGVAPSWYELLVHSSLNHVFMNSALVPLGQPSEVSLDGIRCLSWTYGSNRDANAKIQVWVDMEHGPNPLRIVATNGGVEHRVDSTLEEVKDFGWFPSNVRFIRTQSGRVTKEEELKVHVVQFNRPVVPETFSYSGMGIPVGHIVHDMTKSPIQIMELRDGELVPQNLEAGLERAISARPSFLSRGTLLFANGAVLSFLAIWILWRRHS